MSNVKHDLVIIGGGPAGMSAALVAGRARLSAAVINDESPRNAVTTASHGFLTRDGVHPLELVSVAKEQLKKYETVRYVLGKVKSVQKLDEQFQVELSDGSSLSSARVVIATGYKDDLARLSLTGVEKVYGKSVYPCPFCDGFEHGDQALAVFGGPGVEGFVSVVRMWSNDIVVFTNGARLSDDARGALKRNGVRAVEDPVARLNSSEGKLTSVELVTGERIQRDAGFIGDDFSFPATDFARSLGVSYVTNDWGMEVAEADSAGKTNVEGVYVVGDTKNGFTGVIGSAGEGAFCAENIVHEIAQERWAS